MVALTFVSPSLAAVVPGLPNDHYHAFADPMVFTLVGLGAGLLWRAGPGMAPAVGEARAAGVQRLPMGRALVIVTVVALLGWNLADQPPATHPDGGFPAAELAAARIGRIASTAGATALTLRSLPDFKSTEAYLYPLVRAGANVRADAGTGPVTATIGTLVLICDSLFESAIGAHCGGPAETRTAPPARFGEPLDRFSAAPGRTITIYRPIQ